ncbi:DNA polymerase Y family protein [Corynebacterium liangguodongii]|uniref:DNA polymerase n=1 Tax=Corynebacterium liangguodongii TaxID=2079535 RepID=A0A2S0WCE7_9CORY|nr:DNA polymerase Y family protein [Corynebacterium liangguodongii]AWB83438.1 DNA polymerase [Corynebacterium liangguodongii]PWC00472.1 DNA polymerase Y family protein [Corynebacterium liangguodongii]
MRVAAVWFPDWPVQAARLDADGELAEPIAIVRQHRVKACSQDARARGVRRGMKLRHAQALVPELQAVDDDPERDGRMFAGLAAGLDDVAASVEILRPGLAVVDMAAAGKFHGGEDRATEMLIDASARRGIDACAGVADEIATAVIATRAQAVVEPGGSARFLASQPLQVLRAEEALGADADTLAALSQLGLATLGDVAEVPPQAMATRFGARGAHIHRIARAAPDRRVAPELPTRDLAVAITPEDPIERVDAAAFAARALAAGLHERLKEAGSVCLRLKVTAELGDGSRVERVWRTREALSESATADRVRWQLDGWLTAGGAGQITSLILEPLELSAPEVLGELWSAGTTRDEALRVAQRVQSQLGIDAVVQPRLVGGRGVAERVELVPFGEDAPGPDGRPWPGEIPPPLPARLGGGVDHPASRVRLIDQGGRPVGVSAEVLLTAEPYALAWGEGRYLVTGWAGPWPVDAGWWTRAPNKVARMQVVGTRESAQGSTRGSGEETCGWLLAWTRGSWRVEAVYS